MYDRTSGKDRDSRLSQYIGEFHPELHKNGLSTFSFIAPISNSICAILCDSSVLPMIFIMLRIYNNIYLTHKFMFVTNQDIFFICESFLI